MVYLASYPRSGNTLLRILMHRSFGVRTCSVYEGEHDSWVRDGLADLVGSCQSSEYVKTHHCWRGEEKAVYVRRKVHEIVVSYAGVSGDPATPPDYGSLIESTTNPLHNFRSWLGCPELLILRYEELVHRPLLTMKRLGEFIGLEASGFKVPTKEELNSKRDGFAQGDGTQWPLVLTPEQVRQCDEMEEDMHELCEAEYRGR